MAGYVMFKFNFGKKLIVILGVCYEVFNNIYGVGIFILNGWYGVNGIYENIISEQVYDELFLYLYIKYELLFWLDICWFLV